MTKYDFIKRLKKNGDLKTAISMRVLTGTIERQVNIYESYLRYRSKGINKMDCYCKCGISFNISERRVMTIIKQMEKSY